MIFYNAIGSTAGISFQEKLGRLGSIQRRLGHSKLVKDPEEGAARAQRAAKRRKRRAEIVEKEVEEKGKRLDDTGEQLMRYSTRPKL